MHHLIVYSAIRDSRSVDNRFRGYSRPNLKDRPSDFADVRIGIAGAGTASRAILEAFD